MFWNARCLCTFYPFLWIHLVPSRKKITALGLIHTNGGGSTHTIVGSIINCLLVLLDPGAGTAQLWSCGSQCCLSTA